MMCERMRAQSLEISGSPTSIIMFYLYFHSIIGFLGVMGYVLRWSIRDISSKVRIICLQRGEFNKRRQLTDHVAENYRKYNQKVLTLRQGNAHLNESLFKRGASLRYEGLVMDILTNPDLKSSFHHTTMINIKIIITTGLDAGRITLWTSIC